MELRLNSPVGGSPAKYTWPLAKKKGYNQAKEIIDTIIWGCKDIPDLDVPLKRNILKNYDVDDYESMKSLTKRYNKAINNILSLEKGTQKFCDRLNQKASKDLLHHILQQTYSSAVTNAEELNKYQAFSPDVYGETSFDLVDQMIKRIKLTKDDFFIDLGSGVGQVILQVAATSMCKGCIGIERADVPAKYAEGMEKAFKFWMQWYGKCYGDFELIKGDFFDDCHRETFSEATVIFVNNFAFGPSVDHQLKQRFAELKHGTKIVSSKNFCPLNYRISDRNLSDIGTIMNISEITPHGSSVSWTDKPVTYYLQVIDRAKLEKYFTAKKNGNSSQSVTYDEDKTSESSETESIDSSDHYLGITPPPKKRRCLTARKPQINNNTIIKPGKLVLPPKPPEPIEDIPKKKGKRLKETSRSSTPEVNHNTKPQQFNNHKYTALQSNLNTLVNNFKLQYLQVLSDMSDPSYAMKIKAQIQQELVKNMYLKKQVNELESEIEDIVQDMEKKVTIATAK